MRSSTLIASYLWKDTWSRWLEQPSSALARLFVGALLVMVATVILVAFSSALERSVRTRLESFGLNTLVVRENVSGIDPELLHNTDRPDRLAPLQAAGEKMRLRQLYVRAQTELAERSAGDDLSARCSAQTGRVARCRHARWSTSMRLLPENVLLRVTLGRQSGMAVGAPLG